MRHLTTTTLAATFLVLSAKPAAADPPNGPSIEPSSGTVVQAQAPASPGISAPTIAVLPYRDGVAPPSGYHLEEHPRSGLLIAGTAVLGASYVVSATIALTTDNTDDRWLFVPVFGPFLDLAARQGHTCSIGEIKDRCDLFTASHRFYLALDGIVQLTGSVLFVSGLAFPKKEYVSNTYGARSIRPGGVASWVVVPQMLPRSGYGLTLQGELF
jgi:hypothetical protein